MDGDISTIRQLQRNMTTRERKNENQKRWINNNYEHFREYQTNYQRDYMRRWRAFNSGWNALSTICVDEFKF